ncbi:MAG: hypothetical protein AB7P03_22920 [Kofleriaceae bacterium]
MRIARSLVLGVLVFAACNERGTPKRDPDGALPDPDGAPEVHDAEESALDPFGIQKLYKTAPGGLVYYTKTNAASVTEFFDDGMVSNEVDATLSKNPDGSWHISDTDTTWVIHQAHTNYEITIECKILSAKQTGGNQNLVLYGNGEQHSTDPTRNWHGSANKAWLMTDGEVNFQKELFHESQNRGYTSSVEEGNIGDVQGKWVRIKFVSYNKPNARVLEMWADVTLTNTWTLAKAYLDDGDWPASNGFDAYMEDMRDQHPAHVPQLLRPGVEREITRNEIVNWEGELISFHSYSSAYDFRNASVREIAAP